jgi:MFS family permease
MAENYFCAFLLALGVSSIVAGMSVIIAQFVGVCFQLIFTRFFFQNLPIKKRLLIFLALQSMTLLGLMYAAWIDLRQFFILVSILGLYWGSVLTLNPPWNKLMGLTVPKNFLLKFFTIRNQFGQISVLIGLVISGFLLSQTTQELHIFMVIFGTGFLLKAFSWLEVAWHHRDEEIGPLKKPEIGIRDFLRRLKGTDQGSLIFFLFFFFISVHSASPYFTPYMLNVLKFSYFEYMMVISISFIGRIITFKLLQARAKPRQINGILMFSVIGISSSPLFWSLSQNYGWILFVEFLSGCYWAGFELATTMTYYKKIADHERTRVMSYISFFNVSGMTVGCLLGAAFMKYLPSAWMPAGDRYLSLFIVASCARLFVVLFLPHVDIRGQLPTVMSFTMRTGMAVLIKPVAGFLEGKKKK